MREYEHSGTTWLEQKEITVRFEQVFDEDFQKTANRRAIASGKAHRTDRLDWAITPPKKMPAKVAVSIPSIQVPECPDEALAALNHLYEAGYDLVISKAFDSFFAILGEDPLGMINAYLSEINIGIDGFQVNEERVWFAIANILSDEDLPIEKGTRLYCKGNAYLALNELEDARVTFLEAIQCLSLIHI